MDKSTSYCWKISNLNRKYNHIEIATNIIERGNQENVGIFGNCRINKSKMCFRILKNEKKISIRQKDSG